MNDPASGSRAAAPSADTITPAQLRWIAEAADGMRHQEQVVVRCADGSIKVTADVNGVARDETVLLRIAGTEEGQKEADNFSLVMTAGGPAKELRKVYDSLFWSVSALRKFALPYYMSYDETGAKCQALLSRFKAERNLVAIGHSPTSDPYRIYSGEKLLDGDPFPGLDMLVSEGGRIESAGPVGRFL